MYHFSLFITYEVQLSFNSDLLFVNRFSIEQESGFSIAAPEIIFVSFGRKLRKNRLNWTGHVEGTKHTRTVNAEHDARDRKEEGGH